MNLQQFKVWARQQLGQDGDCGVEVEITDKQLDQCMENAKDWFNAFVGLYREESLNLIGGQSEYDLSAVDPKMESVVKVWFSKRGTSIDFSVLYPGFLDVEGIPYGMSTMWGSGYPQTTIVQTLQTLESNSKFLSVDLDWQFYYDNMTTIPTRMLRVMPPPSNAMKAVYLYRVDPESIKLEHYDKRHMWMIREWALADAKYILGRIRGKYTSGLPAAGGDRTLDGDLLLSESREDKDRLEEKILDFQGPVLPMVY